VDHSRFLVKGQLGELICGGALIQTEYEFCDSLVAIVSPVEPLTSQSLNCFDDYLSGGCSAPFDRRPKKNKRVYLSLDRTRMQVEKTAV
jgi:hypothetical protein